MKRRASTAALLLGAVLLGACAEEDTFLEPGMMYQGNIVTVELPATASLGLPFSVRVRTYGSPCDVPEATFVTYVDDTTVIVAPYERKRTEGCRLLKLCSFGHEAQLVFKTAGDKVVVFRGLNHRDQLVDVPTTVLVQ